MTTTNTINGYEIIRPIAKGGMGAIYLARRQSDGRQVAFKVMRADKAEELGELFGPRFRRELEISKTLSHPYVVRVLDGGLMPDGSGTYIVMEFIEGQDLRSLSTDVIGERTMRNILKQVVEAFSYIHHMGLIHRDVKMENILVDMEGRAILVDFGLALSSNMTRMTATSDRPGTLITMSPEQMKGDDVDGRSDIYSLGVTTYMALSGIPPYAPEEIYQIAVGVEPPKPCSIHDIVEDVSEKFSAIIDKCLELDREKRFESADDLLKALVELEYEPTLMSEMTVTVDAGTRAKSGARGARAAAGSVDTGQLARKGAIGGEIDSDASPPDDTLAIAVGSRKASPLTFVSIALILLAILFTVYKWKSPPHKNNHQETLEWAKDLATMRDEILLSAKSPELSTKIPDEDVCTTLGELVHRSRMASRLKISEKFPNELAGLYYLARYCKENKLWYLARYYYLELVSQKKIGKEPEYGNIYNEFLDVTIEVAALRQSKWPSSQLNKEWVDEAEAVRQLLLPVLHHRPVVDQWQRAVDLYVTALRYKESKEAKDEAIEFADTVRQSKMSQKNKNLAFMEVAGLMTAYVGFGITGNDPAHIEAAKKLTIEVLENLHSKDKYLLWSQFDKLIDISLTQRNFAEAHRWFQRAELEIPNLNQTYDYYKVLANFQANQGNHTKAIEIIKEAKKLKLTNAELGNLNKKIRSWHPYALAERIRNRKK